MMSAIAEQASTPVLTAEQLVRGFAEAISQQDISGAARLLTPDVRVRALLPGGLVEWSGVTETVDRFESWFGRLSAVTAHTIEPSLVGDRYIAGWRLDGEHIDGSGRYVIEQHGVIDVRPDGIERIDLVCTGFRQVPQPNTDGVERWDAGDLGCSDGLPTELRRRIESVDVGGHLEVTVRDPAAKEDLPSLARMMGHRVEVVDEPGDGRLVLSIRRGESR